MKSKPPDRKAREGIAFMPAVRLLDEIDRLFDEMVRIPWARPPSRLAPRPADKTFLEIEMPLSDEQRGDVSVAIEGSRLIVTLRRRTTASSERGTHDEHEQIQRSFALPDDADVSVIETHFEHDVLKVRVGLRERKR
jgi:HSP20 family molecular chaperone IbpA